MAITEIYVDPSIAADSGNGLIGTPYGDLEYAIEQETFDLANGTRINIKAGTDEILAASLHLALADVSVSIAWAPIEPAQLVFQGYTALAGDGGIGGISGGGSVGIFNDSSQSYVNFLDLHLHNCGAASVIDLDNFSIISRCEVDNTSGAGILVDAFSAIYECYIHNTGNFATQCSSGSFIGHNRIEKTGANTMIRAIDVQGSSTIYRNIIKVNGATDGIALADSAIALNNSVWSDGGSGEGIRGFASTISLDVSNNIVEGFLIGFDMDASAHGMKIYKGNSAFNNGTNFTAPVFVMDQLGGNEVLAASAFKDAANGDFSPVNIGSIKEGSLPQIFGNSQ